MPQDAQQQVLPRRSLLALAGAAALGFPAAPALAAAPALRPSAPRTLRLQHLRTGERLTTTYYADGIYLADGLNAIDRLLRDWRQDKIKHIDPAVLDVVFALQQKLNARAPFEIISGYRTQQTNDMLRRTHSGVASKSLHIQGMAIDLRLPGQSLRNLRAAAVSLRRGGVGYYPAQNFVHVDSGPIRYW